MMNMMIGSSKRGHLQAQALAVCILACLFVLLTHTFGTAQCVCVCRLWKGHWRGRGHREEEGGEVCAKRQSQYGTLPEGSFMMTVAEVLGVWLGRTRGFHFFLHFDFDITR